MNLILKNLLVCSVILVLPVNGSSTTTITPKMQAVWPIPHSDLTVMIVDSIPLATVYINNKISKTDTEGFTKKFLPQYPNGPHELIIEKDNASLNFKFTLDKRSYLYCKGSNKLSCTLSDKRYRVKQIKDMDF